MTATNFINVTSLEDINLCDDLISLFHEYEHQHAQGQMLGNVKNKDFKDSTDLSILWEDSERIATIKKYQEDLTKQVEKYGDKYEIIKTLKIHFTKAFNIQFYKPKGGYKKWHFERDHNTQERAFAFMTYLNDVPNGGTEFYYQGTTTQAKKGDTVIWPAEWTHAHKSQVSKDHEKYIATGWLELKKDNETDRTENVF
jgi:prolyl 4-hydroxylase